MFTGKIKIALLAALILIAGGTALAFLLRPRERPLLPRATQIVNISGKFPYYWWLSDHEVMRFRDPVRGDWTLLRLDTNTKTERVIEELTRLFAKSGGKPDSIQVAPDGRWMLWAGARGETWLSAIDGTRHFTVAPGLPSEKRWMCESYRWIELVHD